MTTKPRHPDPPPIYFAEKRAGPGAYWEWGPNGWAVRSADGKVPDERLVVEPEVTPATRLRHTLGGDWILDAPEHPLPVWGRDGQVLWARGESLLLVGGIGTGKTTLGQQLVLHGIGALEEDFLGYPVSLPDGVVGYVAADRPAQIRRSFKRMVSDEMRDLINDRMDVWSGALPFALDNAKVGELADFVQERGWSSLVLDSLKDVCTGTTDDESGLRINQQIQECTARGLEVFALHHQRKASGLNTRPKHLDDVYGSRWLTAGAGSVLMLWADPGAEVVELSHLKQPVEDVGPLMLRHDHALGKTWVDGEAVIRVRGKKSKADSAEAVLNALPGTKREVQERTGLQYTSVTTHLNTLKAEGRARMRDGVPGNEPPVWEAVG